VARIRSLQPFGGDDPAVLSGFGTDMDGRATAMQRTQCLFLAAS
jgi:hypothetical protein